MTLLIFHGEGTGLSRKLLRDAIEKDQADGHEIRTLEGDKLSPKDLDATLSTESLFLIETIVVENLLSRLRSKDKDKCIELLAKYKGNKNIFLWDKKEITKPNLSKLAAFKVSNSKAPTALFTLLESIEPGNTSRSLELLHQVVKDTEDIIVFTMIARQISYLIMIKSGTNPKFAPWQIGKLKSQAAKWESKQLESWITRLLNIDYMIKSGTSKLSYTDHLDLLLLDLLR